jgi:hypothetical protein
MRTFDFENGFAHLTWHSLAMHIEGISLYFGWFPDLDLVGLQVTLMEWSDPEGTHIVPFRFQVLYFMLSLHMDKN